MANSSEIQSDNEEDLMQLSSKISSEDLSKLIIKFDDKYNQHKFKKGSERNIILFGRTRSGKTTIANVIEDLKYVPEMLKLYSQTKKIELHTIVSQLEYDKMLYHFALIDTPGLYEINESGNKSGIELSNEAIMRLIDGCIKYDKTQINVFAFVFSLNDGIKREDIDAMLLVKKHYPQISPFMALIITHSEELEEAERSKLTDDFFRSDAAASGKLKEFFGLGIHYMGCLRPQTIRNRNKVAVADELKAVLQMREKFIRFLISCESYFNIHFDPMIAQEQQEQKTNEINEHLLEYQKKQLENDRKTRQQMLTQQKKINDLQEKLDGKPCVIS